MKKCTVSLLLILFLAGRAALVYSGGKSEASKMYQAAVRGDITAIERLIGQGVDVNVIYTSDRPTTPLIGAAASGQLIAVKYLVAKGADVNMKGWMEIVSGGIPVRVLGFAFHAAALNQHWDIAEFLADAGTDMDRALDTLHQWVDKQPDNPVASAVLANAYCVVGRYDEAVKYAEASLKVGRNALAYLALGKAYAAKRDYGRAVQSLKKALEVDPMATHVHFEMGKIFVRQERFEEAKSCFLKEIRLSNVSSSQMALRLTYLSLVNLALGDLDGAVDAATKAIAHLRLSRLGFTTQLLGGRPIVADVESLSAAEKAGLKTGDKILQVNGQRTEGWDHEKAFYSLSPEEGVPLHLTVERKGMDKPLDLVIVAERLRYDEEAATAFGLRAFANRDLGRREQFLKDAHKSYSLDPDNPWSIRSMAVLYIDEGNLQEALKILSAAKKGNFERLLEAIAYGKSGHMEKASEVYGQISEYFLMSKNPFWSRYVALAEDVFRPYKLQRLRLAEEFESKGLYKEALKEYQEFLKFADEKEASEMRRRLAQLMAKQPHLFALPEEGRRSVIRAETYAAEGDFEKAIREYKNALKIQPFFPALYKALALNYAQLKDYNKAIRHMRIYLELYPDAPDSRAARDEIYRWELLMEKGE